MARYLFRLSQAERLNNVYKHIAKSIAKSTHANFSATGFA
jgi:hypothetical protein